MNIIEEKIAAIRQDRTAGASQLTRQALENLQLAASLFPIETPEDYVGAIINTAHEIAGLRPSMVSISYYMNRYIEEISDKHPGNTDDLRLWAGQAAYRLLSSFEQARKQLIIAGAELIQNGNSIMTCSYSSSVIQSAVQAHKNNKSFSLLIARSQPGDAMPAYGENMARELINQGVNGEVIPDSRIGDYLSGVDMVLLGADAVLADGTLINGYPSLTVARLASTANPAVPVYALCEVSKYTSEYIPVLEPGFELIPASMLTAVINGVSGPASENKQNLPRL